MDCTRCRHPDFISDGICPKCGFHGTPEKIEELSRLEWLLSEMDGWVEQGVLPKFPKELRQYYLSRREETLSALGLTYPPFTAEQAEGAWTELRHHELLFEETEKWLKTSLIKTGLLPTYYARLLELQARLAGHPKPQPETTPSARLEEIAFLQAAIHRLIQRDDFVSIEARDRVLAPLLLEKGKLETALQPPAEAEAERPSEPEELPAPWSRPRKPVPPSSPSLPRPRCANDCGAPSSPNAPCRHCSSSGSSCCSSRRSRSSSGAGRISLRPCGSPYRSVSQPCSSSSGRSCVPKPTWTAPPSP